MESSLTELSHKIPYLTVNAGPTDDNWIARLKEEYTSLIKYVTMNKESGDDWFTIEALDKLGTKWKGKCWFMYKFAKYEFDLEFEIPAKYPQVPFEIVLPELDGKTPKMYYGGKICLSAHFKPLWARNVPRFGIVHALVLGLAPWLAAEIPFLVEMSIIPRK